MFSLATLEKLAKFINGDDIQFAKYRSGKDLERFFAQTAVSLPMDAGEARYHYTYRMLEQCCIYHPLDMHKIISEAFFIGHFMDKLDADMAADIRDNVVADFQSFLQRDGFELVENDLLGTFELHCTSSHSISAVSLNKLSHQFVREQIFKAEKRIDDEDYDGAISTARSLVEAVQIELIKQVGQEPVDYTGDLNKLYKQTKGTFNFDPSQKDIADTLKQTLSGLNGIVVGLAGLSNMIGDRHARKYAPSKHHAKLAVNTAMTFCEFLVDSFEYQQRSSKK